MPFKSESQRRFMYSQHPELAKEFEKATPKGADLPEHVKKMADGGLPNTPQEGDEFTEGIKSGVNHDLDAVKSYLASKFSDSTPSPSTVTSGSPADEPGLQDATVSDFLLPYLLGPSAIKAGGEVPSALKGLGEVGEVTLGRAAPQMEEDIAGATTKDMVTPQVGDTVQLHSTNPNMPPLQVKYNGPMAKDSPGLSPELREMAKEPMFNLDKDIPAHAGDVMHPTNSTVAKSTLEARGYRFPNSYAKGGEVPYPHVTFLENVSTPEMKKTVHLENKAPKNGAEVTKGHEENYAKGGAVHKAEDRNAEPAKPKNIEMSHEEKLKSIYRAMGMKKYADGGDVTPSDGVVDTSQLPSGAPAPNTPGWADWVRDALAQVGTSLGKTIPTMPAVAEGAANAAATPGLAESANAALGTNLAGPAAAPAVPPVATPPAIPPTPLATPARTMPVSTPSATPSPNLKGLFNQDTSALTAGVNPEDRQALVAKMQEQQHGLGSAIAQAVAGLGDALSAKGGRETHSLQNIFSMQKEQRAEALANFDQARQDRLQKLDLQTKMGQNAIQGLAAQDAYGTDERLNKMLGAPPGTAHKDLPLYFQAKSAQVAMQEKDADLYMKAHAQAGTDVDNAIKNASILGVKPSPAQLQASGSKLADQYFNRAKGNILVKPSDGGQAQWIPANNLGKAKQMDPNLQVQP